MFSYCSFFAIFVLLSFAYNAYATSGIGIITTIAGTGTFGFSGDGAIATSAELQSPYGVHVDSSGNVYITDHINCRVRKVDTNGIITTIAGDGDCYYNGDNMAATSASLYYPSGVSSDTHGNIYIVDTGNNRIRKIDVDRMFSTVAGTGNNGFNEDNIAATTAYLNYPTSISLDKAGNMYICDQYNHRIRKVDTNGIITTVAGTGISGFSGDSGLATDASLYYPRVVTSDSFGNIYIADMHNDRIRKVDMNGIITTVAGTGLIEYFDGDNGLATAASLYHPYGVTADIKGNIYIADGNRIRKVGVSGIITTVAGNGGYGGYGYNGDNIAATDATLAHPYSVTTDIKGDLYIADTSNDRIRKVTFPDPPTAMPTHKPTKQPSTSKPSKKTTTTKTPSFRPTNKPTRKKTATPSLRPAAVKPTKNPTKKPTK